MPERELLDEQVICERGSWQRIRRWWRGIHAELGTITRGWTGWETIEERDRVRAVYTFTVQEVELRVVEAAETSPAKAA